MVNQYFGSTQKIGGATYLDSKAILHIEEGFKGVKSDGSGNSTEYINIGDFEISDLSHGGAIRQSLRLNAHTYSKRTNYSNSYFVKQFQSAYSYWDEFNDADLFDQKWRARSVNTGYIGITNSVLQGSSGFMGQYFIIDHEFDSYLAIVKLRATGTGASNSSLGLFSHVDSPDFTSYYAFAYIPSVKQIQFSRENAVGVTNFTGLSYLITASQYYWFKISEFNGTFNGHYSTDGLNYTLGASYYFGGDTQALFGGFIGLDVIGNYTQVTEVDSFEVQELGTIYNKEDVIKGGYAMAGVYGITIAADIKGVSYLNIISTGGCYVYGSSNNVFLSGISKANDLPAITLITSGITFGDFVAEIEYNGSSDTIAGLLISSGASTIGTSSNWYGQTNRPSTLENYNNVWQYLYGTQYVYNNRCNFWNIKDKNWYNLKVIKSGTNLIWEINDQIVNSIVGTTLFNGGTQVAIGIFQQLRSGIGNTVEFRNFRISQLDDVIDNIGLEPGSGVQSLIDRVIPDGYAVNNKSGVIEIYRIGDARGNHSVTTNDYTYRNSQELANIVGKGCAINRSGDNVKVAYTTNTRIMRQGDNSRIDLTVDDLNPTLKAAESQLIYTNKDVQSINIDIANRPTLEQYDTINLIDTYLGVSKQFLAFNVDKTFTAETGQFRETLQLNPFEL